jgi:1-acyl-sn-glycerol-3-phosphate acyltransferase
VSAHALWLPRSTCGPQCLPDEVPTVGPARAAGRVAATLAVLAVTGAALVVLPLVSRSRRVSAVRAFARAMLAALGVRHEAAGRLPAGRGLLAANHMSWLDILVVLAHAPARLLAKREVRGWPVIGWLAAAAGTVFVDRARPRALPGTVAGVAAALRAGAVVAVFPEGTTWCGRSVGPFRPAMFQAAVDAQAPVVPVTLRFTLADGTGTTIAAFLGDDSLLASYRRIVATRGLRVSLRAHPALYPMPGASRRALARAAAAAAHDLTDTVVDRHPLAA